MLGYLTFIGSGAYFGNSQEAASICAALITRACLGWDSEYIAALICDGRPKAEKTRRRELGSSPGFDMTAS